jgi:hypothetical protein
MIALFLFSCSGCLGCGLILWIHLTVIVMMFSICGKMGYQFLMIQPMNARHAILLGVAFLPWPLPKPVRRGWACGLLLSQTSAPTIWPKGRVRVLEPV